MIFGLSKKSAKPVEILLGVRALAGAQERRNAAGERTIFAAERARDLHLPTTFLSNAALGFSYYFPPFKARVAQGKTGAFRDGDGERIVSWVVEMLRPLESPDWDGGRALPTWGGALITMLTTPQIDAPNLMQLLVQWQSGIDGLRCAQFCTRLEDSYIAQGGYYT